MNYFNNETTTTTTFDPTTLAPSHEDTTEAAMGTHPEDIVYLVICVVIFIFAVFGTMFFDKKQQTEQKIQRVRLIMQSLVIQSVEKKNGKEQHQQDTSSSSTTENDTLDEENQIVVGDVVQDKSTTGKSNSNTRSCALERRFRQVTSKVATKSPRRKQSNSVANHGGEHASSDEEEEDVCPICIMPFEAGEKVCRSKNPECDHAFHAECLKPWLMEHSECPCCRKDYLTYDSNNKDNEAIIRQQRELERKIAEKALRNIEYALSI